MVLTVAAGSNHALSGRFSHLHLRHILLRHSSCTCGDSKRHTCRRFRPNIRLPWCRLQNAGSVIRPSRRRRGRRQPPGVRTCPSCRPSKVCNSTLRSLVLDEQQELLIRVVWPKQLQPLCDVLRLLRMHHLRSGGGLIASSTIPAMARAIGERSLVTDARNVAGHASWQTRDSALWRR